MSDFFEHLIARHSQTKDSIKPRLPGRFESAQVSPNGVSYNDGEKTIAQVYEDYDNQRDSPTMRLSEDFSSGKSLFQRNPFSTFSDRKIVDKLDVSETHNHELVKMTIKKEQSRKSPFIDLINDSLNGVIPKSNSLNKSNQLTEVKPTIKDNYSIKSTSADKPEKEQTHPQKPTTNPIIAKKETNEVISPRVEKSTPENTGQYTLTERFNKWMDEPVKEAVRSELKSETMPPIQVNIGRIEVKAITDSPPAMQVRKTAFSPKLSLTEYLEQKNGGKR